RCGRLHALLADVVHQQGTGDLVLPVRQPGLVRQPHGSVVQVIDDLIGATARHLVGVGALLLELGGFAGDGGARNAVVPEFDRRLVRAQVAVLLRIDPYLAFERPAAVGEVQSGGVRVIRLHPGGSLRYDDIAEYQRVRAAVDLGRGRLQVDRWLAGLQRGRGRRRRGRAAGERYGQEQLQLTAGTSHARPILTARDAPSS